MLQIIASILIPTFIVTSPQPVGEQCPDLTRLVESRLGFQLEPTAKPAVWHVEALKPMRHEWMTSHVNQVLTQIAEAVEMTREFTSRELFAVWVVPQADGWVEIRLGFRKPEQL